MNIKRMKNRRFAPASLAALLVAVPVALLALAVTNIAGACRDLKAAEEDDTKDSDPSKECEKDEKGPKTNAE